MNNDEHWMRIAIQEALEAEKEGEVPVGAVLVIDDVLIAKSHNQPILKNDPTAHAEIQALRNTGKALKNYRFVDANMYVTLEPCSMCIGAMIHARVSKVIFGAYDSKSGACGSCIDLQNQNFYNHKIKIYGGVLEQDCKKLLYSFFKDRRK